MGGLALAPAPDGFPGHCIIGRDTVLRRRVLCRAGTALEPTGIGQYKTGTQEGTDCSYHPDDTLHGHLLVRAVAASCGVGVLVEWLPTGSSCHDGAIPMPQLGDFLQAGWNSLKLPVEKKLG